MGLEISMETTKKISEKTKESNGNKAVRMEYRTCLLNTRVTNGEIKE